MHLETDIDISTDRAMYVVMNHFDSVRRLSRSSSVQMNQSEVSITSKHTFSFSQGIEITSTGSSNHYVTGTAAEVRPPPLFFLSFTVGSQTELNITDITALLTSPPGSSVT